jgi:uncharacterized protein DUF4386
MSSAGECTSTVDTSQHRAARVAGFMLLFSLIAPLLNWTFALSKLIVADDAIATADNILANEFLFRIGIAGELFMSAGLIVLAVALYTILKPVGKSLALLALCWKVTEAALVAAIVLVSFLALQVLNAEVSLTAFTPEQLRVPVGLILNVHTVVFSIPMLFLGLDMMLFSYLFFRSKYIPRMLAGFGILSFALVFIYAVLNILAPGYAAMPTIEAVCYAPSGLFELIAGVWLLVKGVNIQSQNAHVSESGD